MNTNLSIVQAITVAIIVNLILLTGCDSVSDSDLARNEIESATTGNAFVQGPPDISGPIVERFEARGYRFFIDDKTGLMFISGIDIVEFCQGNIEWGVANVQDVRPGDSDRTNRKWESKNEEASLWEAPPTCDAILSGKPIATGYANAVFTANDAYYWRRPDSKNAISWKLSSQGKLETTSGKKVNVSAVRRCHGKDLASFKCKTHVNATGY